MDMAAWLDEMTYRLLVRAEGQPDAEERLAVVARWAEVQAERLGQGEDLNVDHESLVAEALRGVRPAATTGGSTP